SSSPSCSTTAHSRRSSRARRTGPRCRSRSCNGAISRRPWPSSRSTCSVRTGCWPRGVPTPSTAATGRVSTASSATRRSGPARPRSRRTSSPTAHCSPASSGTKTEPMQLGIVTPVFTRVPGSHASWEADAGIEEAARIAVRAEELGYHHVTCSEHIGIPTEVAKVRGFTYWDPLSTFCYLAAVTSRLRFLTFVLVLGYHQPMEIVKRYGTLDRVSGGRLILGVGVGSLREEFDLISAEFDDRGARGDDAIRALKASFGKEMPEYHGEYYDYEG